LHGVSLTFKNTAYIILYFLGEGNKFGIDFMIVLKETIGFGEFLYITIWKMTAFAKKIRSRKPHLLMFVSDCKGDGRT
jgi:hypothetical protein